jgi:hypothetical protein
MGDDPMALLGLEGALKHYYYDYYLFFRCSLLVARLWRTQRMPEWPARSMAVQAGLGMG